MATNETPALRLQSFGNAARACALVMLDAGTYIRNELPNVHVEAALRAHVESVCDGYISTKHDVMHAG